MLSAVLLLCDTLIQRRALLQSFSFPRRERTGLVGETSIAGVFPSGETSVESASPDATAGLSIIAFRLEWTSLRGPRPHFSPLETSSSSMTPLAPSVIGDFAVEVLLGRGM